MQKTIVLMAMILAVSAQAYSASPPTSPPQNDPTVKPLTTPTANLPQETELKVKTDQSTATSTVAVNVASDDDIPHIAPPMDASFSQRYTTCLDPFYYVCERICYGVSYLCIVASGATALSVKFSSPDTAGNLGIATTALIFSSHTLPLLAKKLETLRKTLPGKDPKK